MPLSALRTPFRRRRPKRKADPIPAQRLAQGDAAERLLQDWLDRSRLPYLYLEQSPLTMPLALRGSIKRPDFLVAIDGLGTIAVDAKAKTVFDGHFVIEEYERRTLDAFESTFDMPVWYACFPPGEPRLCYLLRNRALMGPAVTHDRARGIIRVPAAAGLAVEYATIHFALALQRSQ